MGQVSRLQTFRRDFFGSVGRGCRVVRSALLNTPARPCYASGRSAAQTCSDPAARDLNFGHARPSSCFGSQPFGKHGALASADLRCSPNHPARGKGIEEKLPTHPVVSFRPAPSQASNSEYSSNSTLFLNSRRFTEVLIETYASPVRSL